MSLYAAVRPYLATQVIHLSVPWQSAVVVATQSQPRTATRSDKSTRLLWTKLRMINWTPW